MHTGIQFDRVHSMQISKIQNEVLKNLIRISKVDFRVISPVVREVKIFRNFQNKSLKWQILRDFRGDHVILFCIILPNPSRA